MDERSDPIVAYCNMGNALLDCVDPEEEKISESFICCVCLDLLYKPIVLACGHVSCFWCVHMSMDYHGYSTCPICRHPYHHFPTICKMLHFLIIKMYPIAYGRRDNQTLEEEKKMGCFSPQFEGSSLKPNSIGGSEVSAVSCPEPEVSTESSEFSQSLDENMEISKADNQTQKHASGTLNQISVIDALCPACEQLLFRPAVLNCGHAYCETCITVPEDDIIKCQVCESLHPCDFPKVCLEWSNFLEETFPKEYASRRDSVGQKQVNSQQKSPPACSSSTKSGKDSAKSSYFSSGDVVSWLAEHGPTVHFGVGCDYCGVLPIVGHRYRCKDCREAIGFDLCADCYSTKSKLPGRFNQQHTADHNFELIKTSRAACSMLLSLATGSFENGSIVISADASEASEDGSTMAASANNPQQNGDNDTVDSADQPNDDSSGN